MKVDRVRANHSLRLTASQGTPNIPFHWFQLLGSYRQAQKKEIIAWLSVRSQEDWKPMNVIKHLLAYSDSLGQQINAWSRECWSSFSFFSFMRSIKRKEKEQIDRIMKEKMMENEERSASWRLIQTILRDRRLMPARTRALSQWSGSSADLLLSLVRTYKRKRKGTCGH